MKSRESFLSNSWYRDSSKNQIRSTSVGWDSLQMLPLMFIRESGGSVKAWRKVSPRFRVWTPTEFGRGKLKPIVYRRSRPSASALDPEAAYEHETSHMEGLRWYRQSNDYLESVCRTTGGSWSKTQYDLGWRKLAV
jgi:hypothetical protein